jgi:tetratricopeptide (TPR) repeat protein
MGPRALRRGNTDVVAAKTPKRDDTPAAPSSGDGATREATGRIVGVHGGMGVQVGDGNSQSNTFHIGTYVEAAYLSVQPGARLATDARERQVVFSAAGQLVIGEIPQQTQGFIARDAQAELSRAGREDAAAAHAVIGLRGVGKTQLAAAYARARVREGWGLVGWVNAESRDTLLAGLARIAESLGAEDPQGDSAESARRLKEHLQARPGESLLVFDNVNDPDQLRLFLPSTGQTHVVITSTEQACAELGQLVELPAFRRPESVRYLSQRTGLADEAGADAVAEELGDLPLGLAQAATTIRGQRLTYSKYLERLHRVPVQSMLNRVPGADYPRSTAAALLMSIEATESSDPTGLTGRLLQVLAALSPHGVHRETLNGLAGNGAADEQELDAAVQRCASGSLLNWSVRGDSVIMHRLLGRVLRERDQAAGRWAETMAAALDLLEPRLIPEKDAWTRKHEGEYLVGQVDALCQADRSAGNAVPGLSLRILQAQYWSVSQLRMAADLSGAIAHGTSTLDDCRRMLGNDHPHTLSSLNNLAITYRIAGQLDKAVTLYEEALADRERVLGSDHPDTLASRNNLAFAYRVAERLDEAVALYGRTLADRERILGPDHPRSLLSRHNLAGGYHAAGRLDEAIALYEQTLADRERVLGIDHPGTLTTRSTLADTYMEAGRLDEGVSLYEQTLAHRERVLGMDHPKVLLSRHKLARAFLAAGRVDEAITLYEQTLADREQTLGSSHPSVLRTRHALADAYQAAGRLDEAITLYKQTLADRERVLSANHPATVATRNSLADAYRAARSD